MFNETMCAKQAAVFDVFVVFAKASLENRSFRKQKGHDWKHKSFQQQLETKKRPHGQMGHLRNTNPFKDNGDIVEKENISDKMMRLMGNKSFQRKVGHC